MTRLFILGAGTPTPTRERFGSAYVVDTGQDIVMFDCGPAATHKLVKCGLFPTQVTHLFFTHHHFDHDADYPCFLLCRWDQSTGSEQVLKVRGPKLTEKLTAGIIGEGGVFEHDWKARINWKGSQQVHVNRGGSLPRKPPSVDSVDIVSGDRVEGGNWVVDTSDALHVQPFLDSLAYRIETNDGSIVITGDTEPCDPVTNLAKGASMLVSMCWDHQSAMEEHGEAVGQTGTTAAAIMARDAGVERLVLVHRGPALESDDSKGRAMDDVRRIYDGEILLADELDVLEL